MRVEKLAEEISQLKKSLAEMEARLASGDVPRSALEDFKMAVDHVRLSVWAVLAAGDADTSRVAEAVTRFRLMRTVEMCRQIVVDINSNEVTTATPELPFFHGTLKETLDRINRLQMAAR
ncbi:MAG: hypothetical protein ACE5IP_08040 [Terriglobia bacterium]